MSDSERDESEEQVFIRFVTRLDDYRVTGEKILVPKKLRRLGLSQLVNHLLGSQGTYPPAHAFNPFSHSPLCSVHMTREISTLPHPSLALVLTLESFDLKVILQFQF